MDMDMDMGMGMYCLDVGQSVLLFTGCGSCMQTHSDGIWGKGEDGVRRVNLAWCDMAVWGDTKERKIGVVWRWPQWCCTAVICDVNSIRLYRNLTHYTVYYTVEEAHNP